MTISTASIVAESDATYGWDNLAPIAGTWRNLAWDMASPPEVVWGRLVGKFSFDFEEVVFKFVNMAPTIPPDAKIVSAVLRGTATQNSTSSTFFTVIHLHTKDGLWDLVSAGPLWRSASPFGTPSEMDVHALNVPGLTTLVDTAVAVTHPWAIRDNATRYLKAGQAVEIVTAGTLGFIDISLDRTGAVGVGNVWCEVYSQDGAGLADTLLATSDTRPASAVPAAGFAPFRFAFSGGNQISLTAGQDIVVVLNGDYPVSSTQNIAVGWTPTGGVHGPMQLEGTGVGFDDQNYPMQDSFRTTPQSAGFIVWVAPTFFVGADYDTPNFGALLQAYIRSGSYVQGDPFSINVSRNLLFFPSGTATRAWASISHATLQPVRLIVEWRKRNRQVI